MDLHVFTSDVLPAMAAAAVYAMVWYARARVGHNESFDPRKFGATIIVGAAIGLVSGLAGMSVTFPTVEAKLAGYAGVITLVEGILKTMESAKK